MAKTKTETKTKQGFISAGSVEEVRSAGTKLVSTPSGPVLVACDGDAVFALDNRCPHMGFPLQQGSIQNGILTCHWHHARFDLRSGCTFDLWADDVPVRAVRIEDGVVWVAAEPTRRDEAGYWTRRLNDGLAHSIKLVIAKSILGAQAAGVTNEALVREGLLYGVRRGSEWGTGLTTLVACANVLPILSREQQALALLHGLSAVGEDTEDAAPRPGCDPLSAAIAPDMLRTWFRQWIRVRHTTGAERTLRTAIAQGLSPGWLAATLLVALTDRAFADGGHALDFTNKAFEGLDIIGWEHAGEVLSSLVPVMAKGQGREEADSWRQPMDLIALMEDADERIVTAIRARGAAGPSYDRHLQLAEALLGDDPGAIVDAIVDAILAGALAVDAGRAVALAAGRRLARFPTSNEHSDWNSAHHTFTYANAAYWLIGRADTEADPVLEALCVRAAVQGALAIYLNRYLNVPPARSPTVRDVRDLPSTIEPLSDRLRDIFDRQHGVDEAARIAVKCLSARHLALHVPALLAAATLREDAGFHMLQNMEAALRQYGAWQGGEAADPTMIGAVRFLAAHSPTRRALGRTADIAQRLSDNEMPDAL